MRSFRPAIGALVLTLTLAACDGGGGSSSSSEGESSAPVAAEGGELDLSDVCPETVVLQMDWQPESEHGAWYNLVGDGYVVDTEAKKLAGPLVAQGEDTGVQLELRTGGPAVGFEPVPVVMYTDPSITIGFGSTDEMVQFSSEQPTTAVVAPLELSPLAILWDRETYPEFNIIADIGQTDTTVLYSEGLSYMAYLTGSGLLRESQLNGSYDGSPGSFVAAGGEWATQGYATAEPYIYEELIEEWGKPLDFQLLHDTGYPAYVTTGAIRTGDKEELAPCLEKLVPIVQQSQVDFIAEPDHAIEIILDATEQYATGWEQSDGLARYTHEKLTELGIVSNGVDDTIGNFEPDRIQQIIDIVTPILTGRREPVKEGLTAEDLFTNEFIDEDIGLAAS